MWLPWKKTQERDVWKIRWDETQLVEFEKEFRKFFKAGKIKSVKKEGKIKENTWDNEHNGKQKWTQRTEKRKDNKTKFPIALFMNPIVLFSTQK